MALLAPTGHSPACNACHTWVCSQQHSAYCWPEGPWESGLLGYGSNGCIVPEPQPAWCLVLHHPDTCESPKCQRQNTSAAWVGRHSFRGFPQGSPGHLWLAADPPSCHKDPIPNPQLGEGSSSLLILAWPPLRNAPSLWLPDLGSMHMAAHWHLLRYWKHARPTQTTKSESLGGRMELGGPEFPKCI